MSTSLRPLELRQRMNAAFRLDPARTAVLTVDMQREYLDQQVGTNLLDVRASRDVLDATRRLLAVARAQSIPVFHAYVVRREFERRLGFGKSAYATAGARTGVRQNRRAAADVADDRPEGSGRCDLMPELSEEGDVHVRTKKTMDSFLGTELDLVLRRTSQPSTLLLAGVNTDTCVLSTALSGSNLGYQVAVVEDCTASVRGASARRRALNLISGSFAWVISLDELAHAMPSTAMERG